MTLYNSKKLYQSFGGTTYLESFVVFQNITLVLCLFQVFSRNPWWCSPGP